MRDDGNLRGRVFRVYDRAGRLEHTSYDFLGNLAASTRTFLDDVDTDVDWSSVDSATTIASMDTADASDLDSSRSPSPPLRPTTRSRARSPRPRPTTASPQ